MINSSLGLSPQCLQLFLECAEEVGAEEPAVIRMQSVKRQRLVYVSTIDTCKRILEVYKLFKISYCAIR